MAALKVPPSYPFVVVLEYMGRLDPRIPMRAVAYNEPARQTRNIRLLGKQRTLVFFTDHNSGMRFHKLGWKTRTTEFEQEWKLVDGKWVHQDRPPEITPIRKPDARTASPNPTKTSSAEDALEIIDALSVKKLVSALSTGAYDGYLKEMLEYERNKSNSRAGAVSAIAARIAQER